MKIKIIDILYKLERGTLPKDFRFKYNGWIWKYDEDYNDIISGEEDDDSTDSFLGKLDMERDLRKEAEVISDDVVGEIPEFKLEENYNEDEDELYYSMEDEKEDGQVITPYLENIDSAEWLLAKKVNKLIRAVNDINKERFGQYKQFVK